MQVKYKSLYFNVSYYFLNTHNFRPAFPWPYLFSLFITINVHPCTSGHASSHHLLYSVSSSLSGRCVTLILCVCFYTLLGTKLLPQRQESWVLSSWGQRSPEKKPAWACVVPTFESPLISIFPGTVWSWSGVCACWRNICHRFESLCENAMSHYFYISVGNKFPDKGQKKLKVAEVTLFTWLKVRVIFTFCQLP